MSSEQIIQELKDLRVRWYEAEFDFYRAARTIEETRREEWRADFVTFDELLERALGGGECRYRAFVEACDVLGEERVRFIGVAASIIAARHKNAPERQKMIDHFEMSRKENGKPLSMRQAKEVQVRLSKEERSSGYADRAQRREGREQELYEEVVTLRKKIKALERENKELRASLARMSSSKHSATRKARDDARG